MSNNANVVTRSANAQKVGTKRSYTTFHSDGESIYKSKAVKEILDNHNIFQKFSPSYHPEQNGMAERTYRTIFADARAMLNTSPLPNNYYPLAIAHSVFLRNLIPKGARKLSAY